MNDPVIEAHHYIWRVAKVPWLNGPQLPRIFGDYGALRRDYPKSCFALSILFDTPFRTEHTEATEKILNIKDSVNSVCSVRTRISQTEVGRQPFADN